MKAAETRQKVDQLLASMSPAERRAVLKTIADDGDGMADDARVTADATKENEEPISGASKEFNDGQE